MNTLTRKDYVKAAYCYVNSILKLRNPEGEQAVAIAKLERYFKKDDSAAKLYRLLCEKAALLNVYQGVMTLDTDQIWLNLLSTKTGLPMLNISGQRVMALKRKNPELIVPIHLTSQYLLRFLQEPSDELMNELGERLDEADAGSWRGLFMRALVVNLGLRG